MEIQKTIYPVQVLASSYQVAGEISPRSNPAMYVNDPAVLAIPVENAIIVPLMPDARIGEMKVPVETFVPRDQIQVLLVANVDPAQAGLRPKSIRLLCFTDTYAIRATFHVPSEAEANEVFNLPGPFYPATNAEIFALRSLAVEIAGQAELVFVNKDAIHVFHEIG
jgi:hypothetical protein